MRVRAAARVCSSSIARLARGASDDRRSAALLAAGDLVVANDTRVFPARLIGRRDPSGGAAECLLLERVYDSEWHALVHPGQKLKPGAMVFEDGPRAPGVRLRGFVAQILRAPPHCRLPTECGAPEWRRHPASTADRRARPCAAAAVHPSRRSGRTISIAIRRFTRARAARSRRRRRVSISTTTIGVARAAPALDGRRHSSRGLRDVQTGASRGVEDHRVDAERFEIAGATAAAIAATRAPGNASWRSARRPRARSRPRRRAMAAPLPAPGRTELFMYPGHRFRGGRRALHELSSAQVVAADAGGGVWRDVDLTLAAYRFAVDRGFHFYSYGDAMLIV